MPSRRGFFHHINQAQSPQQPIRAGGMAPIIGQWSPLLGLALDSAASSFAISGTWSLYMELVRERIDAGSIYTIGSEYPVLDLSNGTGTGEAIGLIGRVSPTGMWSSRSYLRKD